MPVSQQTKYVWIREFDIQVCNNQCNHLYWIQTCVRNERLCLCSLYSPILHSQTLILKTALKTNKQNRLWGSPKYSLLMSSSDERSVWHLFWPLIYTFNNLAFEEENLAFELLKPFFLLIPGLRLTRVPSSVRNLVLILKNHFQTQ